MEANILREYNGYNFYDDGKYEATGLHQLSIYPNNGWGQEGDPIHTLFYENTNDSAINKAIETAKEWVNGLQRCKICGCTEHNCRQCIEKTGGPCSWVEKDLCSACAPKKETTISTPINNSDMNFFQQLAHAGAGKVDITMRVMQKNDSFTINIMPGSPKSTDKPFNITGTAAELDEGFFTTVFAGVQQIKGLQTNLDSVLKEAEKKTDDAKKTTAKKVTDKKPAGKKVKAEKKPAAKKSDKKKVVKKEEPVTAAEPNLFDAPVEEEETATA